MIGIALVMPVDAGFGSKICHTFGDSTLALMLGL
jgi:hypothetical protein